MAATISIRPEQRAHSKTSFRNTRQISEAHGNRPGRRGFFASSSSSDVGPRGASASSTPGTIWDLAPNAGARTPCYAERSIMRSAAVPESPRLACPEHRNSNPASHSRVPNCRHRGAWVPVSPGSPVPRDPPGDFEAVLRLDLP
jgi:hypothetical protein